MLDFDYPQHYAAIVRQTNWSVELPQQWDRFFEETGVVDMPYSERNQPQRRIVRTCGLMMFEDPLPAMPRSIDTIGVYTRDFSKDGCGLVSPMELFPEEIVRVILPTFWLTLRVVRCQRHNRRCFTVGTELVKRHDANRSGFVLGGRFIDVH